MGGVVQCSLMVGDVVADAAASLLPSLPCTNLRFGHHSSTPYSFEGPDIGFSLLCLASLNKTCGRCLRCRRPWLSIVYSKRFSGVKQRFCTAAVNCRLRGSACHCAAFIRACQCVKVWESLTIA